MCSAVCFPVAVFISTKNCFTLCLSFIWKVFERELLYEIRPCRMSFIICPSAYNPIHSSSISSCVKLLSYHGQTVWFFWATILFDEINQLPTGPHICVRSFWLHAGCLAIVPAQRLANQKHECCIGQLRKVTICCCVCALSQIRCRSLVALPSLFPLLLKLTCTFFQKHPNPLSPTPFGIIEIFQRLPGVESLQKVCNHHCPVQGSNWQLFQTVLSPDNGLMLYLQKPSHSCFLLLVEGTKVGLPHPFGKLLEREFHLLQADWGFSFGPTKVWRIVTHIKFVVFVIANIW